MIRPGDDWARYMVASDLVVTDNTSLSATYCQLQKPLVYVAMPKNTVPVGSTVHQLYSISPHLESPADLKRTITAVLREYPYERLREIAYQVNSCPGEAVANIREELFRLLELRLA